MAQTQEGRNLLAIIGDEDSITGVLLAGIGQVGSNQKKNFVIIDAKTQPSTIEAAFHDLTSRKDIAILLINQHVAEKIRATMDKYTQTFPTVLEIPSKDHPYDPSKDSILKRVQKLVGD
ncbi:H(+)-transporting V1 sector ATPase subunit F [Serendipita sp. 411]|nr:H(+)-transporting V1 sector ATPase subunit F [Serendipita sp. 397]KAG8818235.1 H(+)-transporting V1 sector ATPase subunit F [Serendipita sp. 401]KAG8844925.1 H(+)-transporting V1 sector ATPase subunit F [Serendipita sp. 411]KAG9055510.1 H(+)-transporting V1 sector ATPase subunit F [Serendipita sp. 407]